MRCEDHVGFFNDNLGHDLVQRDRRKRCLAALFDRLGFEDDFLGRNTAGVKNLRPAEAEPAIADYHTLLVIPELTGNGFHAVGTATGDDHHRMRVVDRLQRRRDVGHNPLKRLGHMIERAVGEDHGVFKQPVRVDIGIKCGHVVLQVPVSVETVSDRGSVKSHRGNGAFLVTSIKDHVACCAPGKAPDEPEINQADG